MASRADQLRDLQELLDKGILTPEEFEGQKSALLAKQRGHTPLPTSPPEPAAAGTPNVGPNDAASQVAHLPDGETLVGTGVAGLESPAPRRLSAAPEPDPGPASPPPAPTAELPPEQKEPQRGLKAEAVEREAQEGERRAREAQPLLPSIQALVEGIADVVQEADREVQEAARKTQQAEREAQEAERKAIEEAVWDDAQARATAQKAQYLKLALGLGLAVVVGVLMVASGDDAGREVRRSGYEGTEAVPPNAFPDHEYRYVHASSLSLRTGPDAATDKVAALSINSRLIFVRTVDDFTEVTLPDGRSGFVGSKFLGESPLDFDETLSKARLASDPEDALSLWQRVAALSPEDLEVLEALARAYDEVGLSKKAQGVRRELEKLTPTTSSSSGGSTGQHSLEEAAALLERGKEELRGKNADEAIKHLTRCIELVPSHGVARPDPLGGPISECFWERGWAYWLKEDYRSTVGDWSAVERLNPARQELEKWLPKARVKLKYDLEEFCVQQPDACMASGGPWLLRGKYGNLSVVEDDVGHRFSFDGGNACVLWGRVERVEGRAPYLLHVEGADGTGCPPSKTATVTVLSGPAVRASGNAEVILVEQADPFGKGSMTGRYNYDYDEGPRIVQDR